MILFLAQARRPSRTRIKILTFEIVSSRTLSVDLVDADNGSYEVDGQLRFMGSFRNLLVLVARLFPRVSGDERSRKIRVSVRKFDKNNGFGSVWDRELGLDECDSPFYRILHSSSGHLDRGFWGGQRTHGQSAESDADTFSQQMLRDSKSRQFRAKLVLCLKNTRTRKEHIFAVDLSPASAEPLLAFYADAGEAFGSARPFVSVLRKTAPNRFEDVLVSYASPDKSGFPETRSQSKHAHRFSLFSVVALTDKPRLVVQMQKAPQDGREDFYVGVSNLEKLKSFFVRISLRSACGPGTGGPARLAVRPEAESFFSQLRTVNAQIRLEQESHFDSSAKSLTENVFFSGNSCSAFCTA